MTTSMASNSFLKNTVSNYQPAGARRHKIKIMKKAKVSVRELPFRLDKHLRPDDIVVIGMQDGIMFVETPEGEELENFVAGDILEYWFKGYLHQRCSELVPFLGQEVDLIVNGELVFGTVTEINDKSYEVTNKLGKKAYVSINQ